MKLKDRVYRELNAAAARGDFETAGPLAGLDAEDIADGIAAAWDGRNRGRLLFVPGDSAYEADDIRRHVERWLGQPR